MTPPSSLRGQRLECPASGKSEHGGSASSMRTKGNVKLDLLAKRPSRRLKAPPLQASFSSKLRVFRDSAYVKEKK